MAIPAWQVASEDAVGVTIATEGHPDLDTAIRDREYIIKVVCISRRQLWEFFDQLIVVHQLHIRTIPEGTRVICEDTANPLAGPGKDALVVGRADDL